MRDQKAKADAGKARISLVPMDIVTAIARVREYGVGKYPDGGINNWRQVELDRYVDAMARHMIAYLEDPTAKDPESGLPHLWHCATNLSFIIWLENHQSADPWERSADRAVADFATTTAERDCPWK